MAGTIDYSTVLTAFNLTTKQFEELPPPDTVHKERFVFNKLVVLGGCLCLVDDHFHDHFDVWMMKKYGVEKS